MGTPTATDLGRAIREAIRIAGVTQKQVASAVDRDQTTVSDWVNGTNWAPLSALPTIDLLCGKPRGHILRLAGFVDDDGIDLMAAIDGAKDIPDAIDRQALAMLYSVFRERRAE